MAASRRPGVAGVAGVFALALALSVLTSALVSAEAVSDNISRAAPDEAAQYKKGKTSFRKRCARCHGVNMINPGPGIFDLRSFPVDDKPRFVNSVTNGKNAMPSWGEVLKPAAIDTLWVYVTTTPE